MQHTPVYLMLMLMILMMWIKWAIDTV